MDGAYDFGLSGNALVNVLAESNGKDDLETARQYASSHSGH